MQLTVTNTHCKLIRLYASIQDVQEKQLKLMNYIYNAMHNSFETTGLLLFDHISQETQWRPALNATMTGQVQPLHTPM